MADNENNKNYIKKNLDIVKKLFDGLNTYKNHQNELERALLNNRDILEENDYLIKNKSNIFLSDILYHLERSTEELNKIKKIIINSSENIDNKNNNCYNFDAIKNCEDKNCGNNNNSNRSFNYSEDNFEEENSDEKGSNITKQFLENIKYLLESIIQKNNYIIKKYESNKTIDLPFIKVTNNESEIDYMTNINKLLESDFENLKNEDLDERLKLIIMELLYNKIFCKEFESVYSFISTITLWNKIQNNKEIINKFNYIIKIEDSVTQKDLNDIKTIHNLMTSLCFLKDNIDLSYKDKIINLDDFISLMSNSSDDESKKEKKTEDSTKQLNKENTNIKNEILEQYRSVLEYFKKNNLVKNIKTIEEVIEKVEKMSFENLNIKPENIYGYSEEERNKQFKHLIDALEEVKNYYYTKMDDFNKNKNDTDQNILDSFNKNFNKYNNIQNEINNMKDKKWILAPSYECKDNKRIIDTFKDNAVKIIFENKNNKECIKDIKLKIIEENGKKTNNKINLPPNAKTEIDFQFNKDSFKNIYKSQLIVENKILGKFEINLKELEKHYEFTKQYSKKYKAETINYDITFMVRQPCNYPEYINPYVEL